MGQSTGFSLKAGRGDPLYRQLFDQIVARIGDGTYPAGHRLPATRALADELGAHRNTVVRAYEDLEAAGFVDSTVGRGTFVADRPRAVRDAASGPVPAGAMPWSSLLSHAVHAEPLTRADRLAATLSSADAINLSRMQPSNDLLPADLLRRCIDHVMRTVGARALGYTPREGLPKLRELIAADLRRQGVPASAEDLLITSGSQQALDLTARALVNPGDSFLVDDATYHGALSLLSAAGARLVGLPSDGEGPEEAALERHTRLGAKGFYLMPNCQNPTGGRISLARREALVAWSRRAGVPLIEDDFASDLQLDGQKPLASLRALDGDVIYTGTFSKKLVPALRVGYLLCPRALKPHLVALKHACDLGSSGIMQHALAEFLERGYLAAHLGRTLVEYRRRRDALEGALARHLPAGVTWQHPETGLALWLPTPPSLSAQAIWKEAQRLGVLVSPGALNGVEEHRQSGLRLTFCAEPVARLVEGARRLGRAWTAVARRSRGRSVGEAQAIEVI